MDNKNKYIVCAVVMLLAIALLFGIAKGMNGLDKVVEVVPAEKEMNSPIADSVKEDREDKNTNNQSTFHDGTIIEQDKKEKEHNITEQNSIENNTELSTEKNNTEQSTEKNNTEQSTEKNNTEQSTEKNRKEQGSVAQKESEKQGTESDSDASKTAGQDSSSEEKGMSATTLDKGTTGNDVEEKEKETTDVKKVIAIDAGHQLKGNSEKEPNGPGSTVMKAKVSQGTTGVASKVPEYVLNLDVSIKLKEELINRGYEVIMIRDTHDVNISNAERAAVANESADIFLRIHANGSEDSGVAGALTIYPSKDNEYVGFMSAECKKLSEEVIKYFCEATGAKNRGAVMMDNMSGINWCTIPVTIIEMGYMSNKDEDLLMQTAEYQEKMVKGIADGVDSYFQN